MKRLLGERALTCTHLWAALGVFSAGVLLCEVNIFSARHYSRKDVSVGQRYTISSPTLKILKQLQDPLVIYVLLSSTDPHLPELRQLLHSYQAATGKISIDYVDPDRDPIRTQTLNRRLEIGANALGTASDETGLLVESGERRWFIRRSQLSQLDDNGLHHFKMEAALTEAIAQVQSSIDSRICFVTGHGESSLDDVAPEGLIELRRRLTKSNLRAERVALDVASPGEALLGCDAIAVVGPSRPWQPDHEQALLSAWEGGASVGLFLDPIVSQDGQIVPWGLRKVSEALGATPEPGFVLEQDPRLRLPTGLGESFFASPRPHSITQGLTTDSQRVDARVLMTAAAAIHPSASGSSAALLVASPAAYPVSNLNRVASPHRENDHQASLPLAIANEAPRLDGKRKRSFVIGSSNLCQNRSFRDAALFGNRVFVENAFSWLLSRPSLVSVPEKPPARAGLNLSEDSLSSLLRYVLWYMPLAAASLGALILTRRKRLEEDSRKEAEISQ